MLEFLYNLFSLQMVIWLIVAIPLGGAMINGLIAISLAHKETFGMKSISTAVGVLAPIFSLLLTIAVFVTLSGFDRTAPSAITGPLLKWVALPGFVVEAGLKFDQLALVMALVVCLVGSLIHIYSAGYMTNDPGYARFFALLNLIMFFTLLVILADNIILMFFAWEGVAVTTYFLTNFWHQNSGGAETGIKMFLVGRLGSVFLLLGIFLIFGVMSAAGVETESGVFNFVTIERYGAYFVPVATFLSLFIFAAIVCASSQVPMHVWLQDSARAPIPASAFVQSVGVVAISIYLLARLNFIFALSPLALEIMAYTGTATALYAAGQALVARDIGKILAYSTISQTGMMLAAAGVGAFSVAVLHFVMHALFKALLFLSAGSVVLSLGGNQNIEGMGGLRYKMPITTWTFVFAALSLAAVAPISGFFSVNAVLWQAYDRGHSFLWLMAFIGQGITSFYIFRAAGSAFFGATNIPLDRYKKIQESAVLMVFPLMILSTFVILGGIVAVPKVLGGADSLITWLSSLVSYEVGHAPKVGSNAELILMVICVLWSAHFAILSWLIYSQKRDWPELIAEKMSWFYRVFARGFYIDAIYGALVAGPIKWFSRRVVGDTVNSTFMDGIIINGTARAAGFISELAEVSHNGVLERYLLYFLIGVALVVGFMAL